jgi:uncharacterized protein YgiM (DUF1202 family)
MVKSSLASVVVEAHSSNYTSGRKGYKVCKITPHHMAGVLSAEQCGKIFQNSNRNASANYGIGNDGKIACYVGEENRAWTSSSSSNDCQAITIEVSNSSVGGEYPISDAAWNSLVELCVDICKRYNFRLNYDGTASGSLTRHNMFANTNCPGQYLQNRFQELANTVNARLDENTNTTTSETSSSATTGYTVTITASVLNVRDGAGTNYKINTTVKKGEVYTIVEENNGWGKLKSGAGWISLSYTSKNSQSTTTTSSSSSKYVLGLYVVNASALNVRAGAGTNYAIKKTYKKGTRFDTYEIKNNWARTPSGWVCLDYCSLVNKY